MTPASDPQPMLIVGREREQAQLAGYLADALRGQGALALVSGEAGIGKTTLVRAVGSAAVAQGCILLTGACYDMGTPPLYGPWRELVSSARRRSDLPGAPPMLWDQAWIAQAPNSEHYVTELRTYLETLAECGPFVLVLEDLHWADPESLEFLRSFARRVGELPLLLVATYRADDLAANQALYHLLPQLVRESNAQRISPQALDEPAIRTLVTERYALPAPDLARLAAFLGARSQGIPFYMVELLRTLEEEQRLRQSAAGWALGNIDHTPVPVLVRQVIDGRLAQLGPEARRMLEPAAVIGQEVPLRLWQRVAAAGDDVFDAVVEGATAWHVLEEAPAWSSLRFTHALVRDTLYMSMPLPRRQLWHRRIAETLASEPGSEPGTIAYHFRQAQDPRAIEWHIEAGSRAERLAWLTAAQHFELAAEMLGADGTEPGRRGWLLMRRAKLLRSAQPRVALAILETAAALAVEADDALLTAYVKFFRGQNRCQAGERSTGIVDLEESVNALAHLTPADRQRLDELERQGVVLSQSEVEGLLAGLLATAGRTDEALDRTDAIIERGVGTPMRAWWTRGIALALMGCVREAKESFAICREALRSASDESTTATMLLHQLVLVQIPFGADDLTERRRIGQDGEAAWQRSGGAHGDVSARFAWLPVLLIEGDWQAAHELALSGIQSTDTTSVKHLVAIVTLAQLERARGDAALAWERMYELLPGGPQTVPGHVELASGLSLIRVAASLCLDRADLAAAHAWLDAHDRWLTWSGVVLGQADGQLAWADYQRAAGDLPRAGQHAQHALALASEPRQPLALLAAHRLLCELEAHAGRLTEARQHLDAALALADACAAPYERALTLLAAADLQLRAGAIDEANTALHDVRAICAPLGAGPTLARAGAMAARLAEQTTAMERTAPAGLSPREIEVLRLVAAGRSNREIAEALFLSARTVERHITNLYAKIGVHGRSEAIAFAHEHDLI